MEVNDLDLHDIVFADYLESIARGGPSVMTWDEVSLEFPAFFKVCSILHWESLWANFVQLILSFRNSSTELQDITTDSLVLKLTLSRIRKSALYFGSYSTR